MGRADFFFAVVLAFSSLSSLPLMPAAETFRTQEVMPPPEQEKAARSTSAGKQPDAEKELERAVVEAGNDLAARVRNLEEYLKRFPDAPRKAAVYRALAEASTQLRDSSKSIEYAERYIAIQPDDSAMMLFAVDLLEKQGEERSLTKAVGYVSRVLDRIEKNPDDKKPVRVSQEDWAYEQKKLRMSVYLIRGRLEMQRKNYDAAVADLEKSYSLLPNTPAALRLGEIAEIRQKHAQAIEHYAVAFVLPDSFGTLDDQIAARRKLGNLWRLTRGSESGLGDYLLAAYDRVTSDSKSKEQPVRNAGVKDPFAMEVRRLEGPPLKMGELRGKTVVLYFWATWCGPCRELEPLMDAAFERYKGNADVVFLAVNRDEDEMLVAPYVKKEKTRMPVVFSDGLERPLRIEAIPTVVVFYRTGGIAYRAEGFEPEGFLAALTGAIERALAASHAAN